MSRWGGGGVWLLTVMLVTACAPSTSPPVQEDTPQNPRRSASYSAQAVQVTELDGWLLLLTETANKPVCLVLRPGLGTAYPTVRGGYAVSGEGGFYMYIPKHLQVPFFGFYGAQPFGESRAMLGGEQIRYTNDQGTVLGWEGQRVAFRVWSDPNLSPPDSILPDGGLINFQGQGVPHRPAEELDASAQLTTGEVDFTGVGGAYQAMMDCHAS